MIEFKEKSILVTGATSGIGNEIAKKAHALGANVIASGTNQAKLDALKDELKERITVIPCDLSDFSSIENLYKQAEEISGGLDIIVCNAGITRDNLFIRMSEEEWDQVLNVNLKAVFKLNQLAVKAMSKRRKGRIINIASVVGLSGNLGQANYAASKAGMIGMTKTIALEAARRGITVNCIAPGFIQTPMTDAIPQKSREDILGKIPMGRMGAANEIAESVLFLASDSASYITGHVLSVNGGMYL